MKKFKYVHLMTHRNTNINYGIIKMIKNNPNDFDDNEHLFVVGHEELKILYKEDENVIFLPDMFKKNFNKFIGLCKNVDVIFLHQNWFYDFKRFLFTPKTIKRKFFWCVWGHDLYKDNLPIERINTKFFIREKLKRILRDIGYIMVNREVKYYRGIGIGFKYDSLEIKKRFGDKVEIYQTPYISGLTTKYIDELVENQDCFINNRKKTIKIMVGHSAHPYLNHIKMLDILAKYRNENILISLVLVYGNQKYADKVISHAINIFGENKVEILKNRMSIDKYIMYLNTVDVAIFDQKGQSALGNIYELMYLKKKIYINEKGFLKTPFELEGIYTSTTKEIEEKNFEEFIAASDCLKQEKEFSEYFMENQNRIKMWKRTLYRLDKNL
ncbi:hypothetical protein GNF98_13005 [Clostridium perfringens]